MKNLLVTIVAICLVAACAGTPFNWSQARQIKPGMTVDEVTQLVGSPNNIKATGDTIIYVWVFVNTMSGSTRTLRVDFKDGKAITAPPIPDSFQD
jgi:outer membrane protein assembly factor BamE (lipoprotein component of BamABCDE complex)